MCGERQLPRRAIWLACEFCQENAKSIEQVLTQNSPNGQGSSDVSRRDVWQTAFNVHNLFTIDTSEEYLELETLLDLARKSMVKYPRDKIYGLLAILPNSIASQILPDYNKTTEEVYRDFATSVLQQCKRLDEVLSWCSFAEDSSLPSWIPDWASPFSRYQMHWLRIKKAGGDMTPIWSLPKDSSTLRCNGVIVDTAGFAGIPLSQSVPYRTVGKMKADSHMNTPTFGRYHNKEQLALAVHRVLIQNHQVVARERANGNLLDIYWIDWDQPEATPDFQMEKFWKFGMQNMTEVDGVPLNTWEVFYRFRQTNAYFPVFGHFFRDFFPSMRRYLDRPVSKDQYPKALVDECNHFPHELTANHGLNMSLAVIVLGGRKLITTNTGFLGLAPEETLRGDFIAVLYGCNFPVVLRRSDNAFKYIGECYIDGLMDGEAIEAQTRGDYKETEITIC
jgi:hypothetical protein